MNTQAKGTKPTPKSPTLEASLAGVTYADEITPEEAAHQNAVVEAPAGKVLAMPRSKEQDARNQAAARAVIEAQRSAVAAPAAGFQEDATVHQELPTMSAAEEARLQPKLFQVQVEAWVARGGAKYRLAVGKIISENEYDIPQLRKFGVKLEPFAR